MHPRDQRIMKLHILGVWQNAHNIYYATGSYCLVCRHGHTYNKHIYEDTYEHYARHTCWSSELSLSRPCCQSSITARAVSRCKIWTTHRNKQSATTCAQFLCAVPVMKTVPKLRAGWRPISSYRSTYENAYQKMDKFWTLNTDASNGAHPER